MSLADTVTRMLSRFGSTWTYRTQDYAAGANDWTAGALTETFSQFTAQGREATPDEIANGGLQQGDWEITADPASFSVTPKIGDMVAAGTYTEAGDADWLQIVEIHQPSENNTTRVYKLMARL